MDSGQDLSLYNGGVRTPPRALELCKPKGQTIIIIVVAVVVVVIINMIIIVK